MPKTNFTKVEDLLDKGISKRKIDAIVDETKPYEQRAQEGAPKLYLIESIRYDISHIPKYDKDFFKHLALSKKELYSLIKSPQNLSEKDWQLLQDIRTQIDARKIEVIDLLPDPSNEELVEQEQKRHIYKRYNVNEKWLPLY